MSGLHPDDGIQRTTRFPWYVAAGVDCAPFDRNAWRERALTEWKRGFSAPGNAAGATPAAHRTAPHAKAKSRGGA